MPKVEKESQSESPKSTELEPQQPVDVAKLVKQQLRSLSWSGLSHIPKGTGEFVFEFSSDPESAESSSPATDANESQTSSSSSVVRETKPSVSPIANTTPSSPPSISSSKTIDTGPYGETLPLEERTTALKVLQDKVAGCSACPELAESRTQTVFGVGNPQARLVFFGEAPGANEDRLGEPFVGEAGQLLDKILGACGLSRADIYLLNTVKCRPPANRNPSQSELGNCWGFAEQQLELLQPEFICCLGSVASRVLLKTNLSIGKLRRQFHSYRGSKVLVTYHPAYLLRTPSAKKHVWEDMKLLMQEMGIQLPN